MEYNHQPKYKDKYGEIWTKIYYNKDRVVRISDGNIGGWFNGEGLTRI